MKGLHNTVVDIFLMETPVTLLCKGNVLNGVVDGKNVSSESIFAWWGRGVVSTGVIIVN